MNAQDLLPRINTLVDKTTWPQNLKLSVLVPSCLVLLAVGLRELPGSLSPLLNPLGDLIVTWDSVPALILLLCLAGGALFLAYRLLSTLYRVFEDGGPSFRRPVLVTVAVVCLDTFFVHRPQFSYVAAFFIAFLGYRANRRQIPILITLLVFGLIPIYGNVTRWAVLIAVVGLALYGILALHRRGALRIDWNFVPAEGESWVYCVYLLTVGLASWSQLSDLIGWRLGALLYLPLTLVNTSILSPLLIRREVPTAELVLAPQAPVVPAPFMRYRPTPDLLSSARWDDLVELLSESPYREYDGRGGIISENRHLLLGYRIFDGEGPVLLDRNLLKQHLHILGRTGSGKTTLGIMPILTQLIRGYAGVDPRTGSFDYSDPEPVVVLDLKGDRPLFETVRQEAEKRGQDFLFFSADPARRSYYFNPFSLFRTEQTSLPQQAQSLLDALGLNHGEGYGRSYFTRISRQRLMNVLREYGTPTSFKDLHEKLKAYSKRHKQTQDTFELEAAVEAFLFYPHLFTTPDQERRHPQSIIHFDRVLEEAQVVYFWLPGATQSISAREIGKLVLFNLFTAAKSRADKDLPKRQAYLVIDEFQRLVGENLTTILEQARSFNIATILSNHSAAQLKTADNKNLWPIINDTTAATLYFGTSNIDEIRIISELSDERFELRRTTTETSSSSSGHSLSEMGAFQADINTTSTGSQSGISHALSEHPVPRLKPADIVKLLSHPERFIFWPHADSGFTRFSGLPTPVQGLHIMPEAEHERRESVPWPTVEPITSKPLHTPTQSFEQTLSPAKMNSIIQTFLADDD
jgi:hypothetical protein